MLQTQLPAYRFMPKNLITEPRNLLRTLLTVALVIRLSSEEDRPERLCLDKTVTRKLGQNEVLGHNSPGIEACPNANTELVRVALPRLL